MPVGVKNCSEIIADDLKKAGFSVGWVSALDCEGRTIWIVDAHGYGKRFIVRGDEKLTTFVELETEIRGGCTLRHQKTGNVCQPMGSLPAIGGAKLSKI